MGLEGSAFFRTDKLLRTRPFRWWITVFGMALLAWGAWFFIAPLPQTAASQTAIFSSAESINASFTPDVALTLTPNQPVTIRLDQFPWQEFGTGHGVVVRRDDQIRNDQVEVEIRYQSGLEGVPLQRDLTAQIIVTTEQMTPAKLLWQRLVRATSSR